ncbi:MAG TPA: SDR family oxidoreductase [Edaphocola sp.]|nr:SDR family oxidoreductase [Edaphocola sp.]
MMRTVLISGANQGIGFETARQLARSGCFVYLGSRTKSNGEQAVSKLKESGISNIAWMELDVTDVHSVKRARQELESQTGVLDVLINNAGIAGEQPQNMSAGDMGNLRNVFETNFFGVVRTTQQFIPLLKRSSRPVIINVSSEMGSLATQSHTKNPNRGSYDAYSCSKAALNAFTVMLSNELMSAGFRINSVTPGYTATNLNQYQGAKTPEEGASAIVKYVTMPESEMASGKFFNGDGEIPW